MNSYWEFCSLAYTCPWKFINFFNKLWKYSVTKINIMDLKISRWPTFINNHSVQNNILIQIVQFVKRLPAKWIFHFKMQFSFFVFFLALGNEWTVTERFCALAYMCLHKINKIKILKDLLKTYSLLWYFWLESVKVGHVSLCNSGSNSLSICRFGPFSINISFEVCFANGTTSCTSWDSYFDVCQGDFGEREKLTRYPTYWVVSKYLWWNKKRKNLNVKFNFWDAHHFYLAIFWRMYQWPK